MIRVMIVDDELLIRSGIRMILAAAEDVSVVAEAGDGREAVAQLRAHPADVVLLDIRMPVQDGLTTVRQLREVAPNVRIVILTTFGEDANISQALRDGAVGFLLKDTAPEDLIRAIHAVHGGAAYLSPAVTRQVVDRMASDDRSIRADAVADRIDLLSAREREVLVLLGQGMSNAEIGGRLFMSEATIKTYVSRILTKLDCVNRVQAAIMAHDAGIIGQG